MKRSVESICERLVTQLEEVQECQYSTESGFDGTFEVWWLMLGLKNILTFIFVDYGH